MEWFEHAVAMVGWNAGTVVDDGQLDLVAGASARDLYGTSRCADDCSVGQEVGQHTFQQDGIGHYRRQVMWHGNRDQAAVKVNESRCLFRQRMRCYGLQFDADHPGLKPAQRQQIVYQLGELISAVVDGCEQLSFVLGGQNGSGLAQAGDRGFDAGKGGAQVVADRGQQGGADTVDIGQVFARAACRLSRCASSVRAAAAAIRRRVP